jgi:hypothetical protein
MLFEFVLIFIAENRDRLKGQLEIISAEEAWCVPEGYGLLTTLRMLVAGDVSSQFCPGSPSSEISVSRV